MDSELKKLRKLTKFCRDNGVLRAKTAEIELELAPAALFPDERQNVPRGTDAARLPEVSEPVSQGTYSDTDILLWSAPGLIHDEGSA